MTYYTDKQERKRERGQRLSQGLSQSFGGAMQGLDAFGKLQAALAEKQAGDEKEAAAAAAAAEERSYKRGRDTKSDVFAAEGRANDVQDKALTRADRLEELKRSLGKEASDADLAQQDREESARRFGITSAEPALDRASREKMAAEARRAAAARAAVVDPMRAKRDNLVDLQTRKLENELNSGDKLRPEFNSQPAVKDFNVVKVAHDKMKKAAANGTPAGDLSLIYSFMKMQDPGSTVRESEFAAAAKAGSFGDQIQGRVEQVLTGERLTPDQRADFLSQGQGFYDSQKEAYDQQVSRYGGLAKSHGATPSEVTGEPDPDAQKQFLERFRVRRKDNGKTGTIAPDKFDPNTYERIQ